MAANIICYYNLANKQGIMMVLVLPVVINQNGQNYIYSAVSQIHTDTG